MVRPRERKTYIDSEGREQVRQLCSIEGCTNIRMLCSPVNGVKVGTACQYELSTCSRHRKDGGTFRCHSTPKKKEHIWRAQGISLSYEKFVELLELNGYCCWLCGKPQSEEGRSLGVDHDHKTGKIRGILCRRCNASVGWIENVTSLEEIQEYLRGDMMSLYSDKNEP